MHTCSHVALDAASDVKGQKAVLLPSERREGQRFTPLAQVLEVAGNFWVPRLITPSLPLQWCSVLPLRALCSDITSRRLLITWAS